MESVLVMVDCRFLLYMIDDGDWHRLDDVALEVGWPKDRLVECVRRLADARLIHYDEESGEIKVQNWLLGYPRGVWEKPGKRSVGSVIVASESAVKLQETEIENHLGFDVEITFHVVDGKLKLLSIEKSVKEPEPKP